MTAAPRRMSLASARRIALAAQGFDKPRPARPVRSGVLARLVERLGLLQIDFVNVLVPAHFRVPFSRLGPYDRVRLEDVIYRSGRFTEQWAHEASIVPVDLWPLLRHRMERFTCRPRMFESFIARHPEYFASVLEEVRDRGPLTAEELHAPAGVDRRLDRAWVGTIPRAALETHFGRGTLAVVDRKPNMARVFDLPERAIPVVHRKRCPSRDEAERELLRRAARAHGVGTAADLADYYRMPPARARTHLETLVGDGELQPVRVEGWSQPAYLDPGARRPQRLRAAALLSPFDPVVWFRPRCERLFDFHYRIEIYVPRPKRRWGYYVLPFLLGDRLVARVDLKADRKAGLLRVEAAHPEAHADPEETSAALACELTTVARWLDLDGVAVGRRGKLASALAAAVRRENR